AASVTDKLGVYVEYFGFYTQNRHTAPAHSINGGVTYLIHEDFQIDWRIGGGVSDEADDFFTGVGFARRF
ncbi:MAG: transporter, partial [Planctomycetota bacterium]